MRLEGIGADLIVIAIDLRLQVLPHHHSPRAPQQRVEDGKLAPSEAEGKPPHPALSARYDRLFGGDANSELSEIDPGLPDLELEVEGGYGLEASAIMTVPFGRRAINFGPFVRYWNIDQSKSFVIANPEDPSERIEFFEPKNRTTELGVRVSFSF